MSHSQRLAHTVFIVAALLALATPPAVSAQTVLVRAKHVHLGDGKVLSPGAVLVADGKIMEVAGSLKAADADSVIDVSHVTPGLVDAMAPSAGVAPADAERTRELTPDAALIDCLDWDASRFRRRLEEGVVTLHLAPGSDNVVGGMSCIVKTAGESAKARTLRQSHALFIAVCEDPSSGNRSRQRPDSIYVRQPTNRMGVVWMLRNAFQKTKSKDAPTKRTTLSRALNNEIPIYAVSRLGFDIRTLFRIADEFDFEPTVVGGQESWKLPDELAQRGADVILGAADPGRETGPEGARISPTTAAKLREHGVRVCLSGNRLLDQARFAVRAGMGSEDALAMISSAPAQILGVDGRVGRIAAGCDADLAAFDGPPMEFTSRIQWVMTDGVTHLLDPQSP